MVQCFPLVAILKALRVHKVDYFSLDVEGNEMDVLRAIDFDSVDIKVLLSDSFYDMLSIFLYTIGDIS